MSIEQTLTNREVVQGETQTPRDLPDYRFPLILQQPVKPGPCPVCKTQPGEVERLTDQLHAAQDEFIGLGKLLTGTYPHTPESQRLRADALALLGKAAIVESWQQLERDEDAAVEWAQDHLNALQAHLSTQRQSLADHLARCDRSAALTAELQELGSRLEAAQVRRAEASTVDEKVDSEASIAAIERVIASQHAERESLYVPFNEKAVETSIHADEIESREWERLADNPDAALRALCDDQREQFGDRISVAIVQGLTKVSAVAFEATK